MTRWRFIILCVALGAGALSACGGADSPAITVAAASDLAPVFDEATEAIETECGVELRVTLGSSGLLSNQVAAGAPYDVFLSADAEFPRDLAARGLAAGDEVVAYALGRIVIAWPEGAEPITTLDALRDDRFRRIAIANPEHAPYGRAAEEALRTSGMYEAIESRLVIGENVRQAYDYVRGSNADAGIVAVSLVAQSTTDYTAIDAALHQPITQSGIVVADRPSADAARCVLDFLQGDDGQRVLSSYGFETTP